MAESGDPTLPEIIDATEEALMSLESVLKSLTPEQWKLPTGCPGWDVHDVACHVMGVEHDIAGDPQPDHVVAADLAHLRDANGRSMEVRVDARRGASIEEVLSEYGEVTRRGTANRRASNRDPEEPTEGPFGWKMPYRQLMAIRTFDCFAHEQDVRRAVGQPGNLDGKAAAIVGNMFVGMLPGLLASRVSDLGDRSVTVEVTEPCPATLHATTIGGGEPAAHVTLPFSELVALVCGRADVRHDLIAVEGDENLANQLLGSMAVTP